MHVCASHGLHKSRRSLCAKLVLAVTCHMHHHTFMYDPNLLTLPHPPSLEPLPTHPQVVGYFAHSPTYSLCFRSTQQYLSRQLSAQPRERTHGLPHSQKGSSNTTKAAMVTSIRDHLRSAELVPASDVACIMILVNMKLPNHKGKHLPEDAGGGGGGAGGGGGGGGGGGRDEDLGPAVVAAAAAATCKACTIALPYTVSNINRQNLKEAGHKCIHVQLQQSKSKRRCRIWSWARVGEGQMQGQGHMQGQGQGQGQSQCQGQMQGQGEGAGPGAASA